MPLRILLLPLLISATLTITGCAKEEGPMEKAGKSLDKAAENVESSAKEASDEIKKAVDD